MSILTAVEGSLNAMSWLTPADDATKELARSYARAVDSAIEAGDPGEITKSLYLGPHLLNTLRALGGTPDGRKDLAAAPAAVDPVATALASITKTKGARKPK